MGHHWVCLKAMASKDHMISIRDNQTWPDGCDGVKIINPVLQLDFNHFTIITVTASYGVAHLYSCMNQIMYIYVQVHCKLWQNCSTHAFEGKLSK